MVEEEGGAGGGRPRASMGWSTVSQRRRAGGSGWFRWGGDGLELEGSALQGRWEGWVGWCASSRAGAVAVEGRKTREKQRVAVRRGRGARAGAARTNREAEGTGGVGSCGCMRWVQGGEEEEEEGGVKG